jgi:hypothetical protein
MNEEARLMPIADSQAMLGLSREMASLALESVLFSLSP